MKADGSDVRRLANNPDNWSEDAHATLKDHVDFLNDLGRQRILLLAGRTLSDPGDDRLWGIAVIIADSQEHAEKLLAADPAVVEGIQKASIHPFLMAIEHFENAR